MEVTLYSTHCPKCEILSKKLKTKNIEFDEVNDTKTILQFGKNNSILTLPILDVDGNIMDYIEAINWVNSR